MQQLQVSTIITLLLLLLLLLLQDLRRARMVLWVDDVAAVITNSTAPFFDAFSDYIAVKQFNYSQVGCEALLIWIWLLQCRGRRMPTQTLPAPLSKLSPPLPPHSSFQ
jgi:hypothetical protein